MPTPRRPGIVSGVCAGRALGHLSRGRRLGAPLGLGGPGGCCSAAALGVLSPLSARFIHQVNQAAITIQRWYRHQAQRRRAQAASLGHLLASKLEVGVGVSRAGAGGNLGPQTGFLGPTPVGPPSPRPEPLPRSLGRQGLGVGKCRPGPSRLRGPNRFLVLGSLLRDAEPSPRPKEPREGRLVSCGCRTPAGVCGGGCRGSSPPAGDASPRASRGGRRRATCWACTGRGRRPGGRPARRRRARPDGRPSRCGLRA